MLSQLRPALVMTVLLTVITGILYPLAVTGLAQLLFPFESHGSLIERDGIVIGSRLIGQGFTGPGTFHPRPSAAGDKGYDAAASSGSNLAPTAKALVERVGKDVAAYRAENGPGPAPADAVTTSGSGLDPHISLANALRQAARVAQVRGLDPALVHRLIGVHTERPALAMLGEPGVNVVTLNLDLDALRPEK
ncbi:K(+) transporting P-type ATPase subunit KdpC [uncultured Gammaproteobacteria bacterium]